jgi:hypothetical protein
MRELFPVFNAAETRVVEPLTDAEIKAFTTTLRKIVLAIEAQPKHLE